MGAGIRIAAAASLAATLLAEAPPARALSCASPAIIYVASCAEGRCDGGFVVEHTHTMRRCETVPEIRDLEPVEIAQVLVPGWEVLGAPERSGVIELTTTAACAGALAAGKPWNERCREASQAEIASPDPGKLEELRASWEAEAASARRRALVARVAEVGGLVLSGALALGLLLWFRARRPRRIWLLLAALIEIPLAALLLVYLSFLSAEGRILGLVSVVILVLAALIELVWIVVRPPVLDVSS